MTPRGKLWLGSVLAFVSALCFASNLTLASVVYAHGGNVHGLNLARSLLFTVVLLIAVKLARVPLTMTPPERRLAIGLGVILCVELYAILIAIQTIPVGLAVLVMYTYPLMVAALSWVLGREVFSVDALCAVLATFTGLALALYVPTGAPDWFGVTMALLTAACLTTVVVLSERLMARIDRRVVMLHLVGTTTIAVAIVSLTAAEIEWPGARDGWAALAGSTVFYVAATFLLFTAIDLIGPMRTAVIDNAAPIFAIALAALLLDEHMSAAQLFGVALVIAAVVLVQLSLAVPGVRHRPKP